MPRPLLLSTPLSRATIRTIHQLDDRTTRAGDGMCPLTRRRGTAVSPSVAHIVEEQQSPSGRYVWDKVKHAIPYVGGRGKQEA